MSAKILDSKHLSEYFHQSYGKAISYFFWRHSTVSSKVTPERLTISTLKLDITTETLHEIFMYISYMHEVRNRSHKASSAGATFSLWHCSLTLLSDIV